MEPSSQTRGRASEDSSPASETEGEDGWEGNERERDEADGWSWEQWTREIHRGSPSSLFPHFLPKRFASLHLPPSPSCRTLEKEAEQLLPCTYQGVLPFPVLSAAESLQPSIPACFSPKPGLCSTQTIEFAWKERRRRRRSVLIRWEKSIRKLVVDGREETKSRG